MSPQEIREARLSLEMTQTRFGELLHAKLRTVQDWEGGKRNMPAATEELLRFKLDLYLPTKPLKKSIKIAKARRGTAASEHP